MQITRQHLIDWSACDGGREWFDANYPSGEGEYVAIQMALQRDGHRDYSNRLSLRVIDNLPDAALAECSFASEMVRDMTAGIVADFSSASSNASAGFASSNASAGDDSSNASAGNYSRNASAGNYSRNASAGDDSRNASAGNYSRNASAGDYSRNEATGKNSVIAAAGRNSKFKAAEGGCAAIAYHDGTRVRFAVAYVGENVKADTWYSVNERGEFVEVE